MAHVWVEARICSLDERLCEDVRALVDTGATLSIVPRELAEKLGLKPHRTDTVEMGAGMITVKRAAAVIYIENRKCITEVWVSELLDKPLIGVTTLEMLGLVVDPRTGKLKEAPLLFY